MSTLTVSGVIRCNCCGREFKPSPSQLKRRDYMCSPCVQAGRRRRGKPKPNSSRTPKRRRQDAVRNAVQRALKTGRLVRTPCEVCGDPDSVAHHPDYSKPLDVQWLCGVHHWAIHKQMSQQGVRA